MEANAPRPSTVEGVVDELQSDPRSILATHPGLQVFANQTALRQGMLARQTRREAGLTPAQPHRTPGFMHLAGVGGGAPLQAPDVPEMGTADPFGANLSVMQQESLMTIHSFDDC